MLRIITQPDGTLCIARSDKETEAYLDSKYVRVPNELRWAMPPCNKFVAYQNKYFGQECYIIGKGPSLDKLELCPIEPNCPVIALNEAVHKVESIGLTNDLFATQLDSPLGQVCTPKLESTVQFLSLHCASYYLQRENRIIVDRRTVIQAVNCLSVLYAMAIAKYMGCSGYNLIGFDGCLKINTEYANCIGHSSTKGGDPKRFHTHKRRIVEFANGTALKWFTFQGGKFVTV